MEAVKTLADCVGNWSGASTLQDPHAGIDEKSPSTASFSAVAVGSFRFEYSWSYHGKPQEGSLLVGIEGLAVTAEWTDTWHTANKPMACVGQLSKDTAVSVRGAYAAPPGPDWGWRIDLAPEKEQFHLAMWNIWPAEQGGKEELAVEAVYTRSSPA